MNEDIIHVERELENYFYSLFFFYINDFKMTKLTEEEKKKKKKDWIRLLVDLGYRVFFMNPLVLRPK